MAVQEENYAAHELSDFTYRADVVAVKRGKNGSWKLMADVHIEIRLPDGRLVTAWEEVKLRGRGQHKPRPDPKWPYEGKRGRARKRKEGAKNG
jgi:hypothetical protein